MTNSRVGNRRPGGGANTLPELVLAGEMAEAGRSRGGRDQCCAVEAGENMSLKDVGVEGGNSVAVVIGGGGTVMKGRRRRRKRHNFDVLFSD